MELNKEQQKASYAAVRNFFLESKNSDQNTSLSCSISMNEVTRETEIHFTNIDYSSYSLNSTIFKDYRLANPLLTNHILFEWNAITKELTFWEDDMRMQVVFKRLD